MDLIHEDLLEGKGIAKEQRAQLRKCAQMLADLDVLAGPAGLLWRKRREVPKGAHCNNNRGGGIIRNGDEVDRGCALAPVSGWVDGNTGIAQPRSPSPPVRMPFHPLCGFGVPGLAGLVLGCWAVGLWAGSLVSRPCPVDSASRRSLPLFSHCGGSSIKLP